MYCVNTFMRLCKISMREKRAECTFLAKCSFRRNDKFVIINIIYVAWSKFCRVCADIKMNRAREKEEYV